MVSRKTLVLVTGLLVLAAVALPAARAQKGAPAAPPAQQAPAPPAAAEYTFSGPFTPFGGSPPQAAGKDRKLAVNQSREQRRVWREVAENQRKLSDNLMKPVQAAESPTSLQLAQEDKDLLKTTDEYLKALSPVLA